MPGEDDHVVAPHSSEIAREAAVPPNLLRLFKFEDEKIVRSQNSRRGVPRPRIHKANLKLPLSRFRLIFELHNAALDPFQKNSKLGRI